MQAAGWIDGRNIHIEYRFVGGDPARTEAAAAELVAMTMKDIADRRALWHGTMTPEQREKVLSSVFDEP